MEEMLCETRTMVIDNCEVDLIKFKNQENWKIHNFTKAAIRPLEGSTRKKEYYLYGIPYNKEEFFSRVRDREGLPWHKNPAMRGVVRF